MSVKEDNSNESNNKIKPLEEKYTIKIHNKVIKMSKHKYFLLVFFTSIIVLFLSFLLVFAFAYPKHLTDMLLGFLMLVIMVGIQLMLLSAVLKHIKWKKNGKGRELEKDS